MLMDSTYVPLVQGSINTVMRQMQQKVAARTTRTTTATTTTTTTTTATAAAAAQQQQQQQQRFTYQFFRLRMLAVKTRRKHPINAKMGGGESSVFAI